MILLFDEVEKASDSLWQLLLGILDKATLTLGDNRRIDYLSDARGCGCRHVQHHSDRYNHGSFVGSKSYPLAPVLTPNSHTAGSAIEIIPTKSVTANVPN